MRRSLLGVTFSAVIAVSLLQAAPAAAATNTFRCGSALIYEGDEQARVLAKCGEPNDIHRSVAWRPSGIWRYGRFYASDSGREVPVEVWIYNRGPNQFVRRLKFEDGELVEIETLGYGYNE
jgi:hypothetical protein